MDQSLSSRDDVVYTTPFFINCLDKTYYVSQPRQTLLHVAVRNAIDGRGPTNILYGGAAGGGKTEGLLWVIFALANDTRFKNLKIGVFRKTFPEIEKYFILRAIEAYPNPSDPDKRIYTYRQKDHSMTFHQTGTTVWFNYCETELDVVRYQGAQFDVLIIDELTHHTEYVYRYLSTRNRTTNPNFTPIFIASTNPGGLGHTWVKRLWIDRNEYSEDECMIYENGKWRQRSQEETAREYLFIKSKVWDNQKLIQNNPKYLQKLRSMPEMDRRALLDGDWDIFAGQYFREIRREVHAFDPLTFGLIPHEWTHFVALDYGYFPHPASIGWYAVDEQGTIYRYKELLIQRHTFSQLAKAIIKNCTPAELRVIQYVVIPPDIFAKRGAGEGKSGAEEIQDVFDAKQETSKWNVYKADNDRLNGWYQCREYLKPIPGPQGTTARFRVSSSCLMWWKQVPQLQHDPKRPEDIFKFGVTEDGKIWQGDDVGDEMRYAIMSRYVKPKVAEKKQGRDRYGQRIKTGDVRQKALRDIAMRPAKRPDWHGRDKPRA